MTGMWLRPDQQKVPQKGERKKEKMVKSLMAGL
jgi:hypothetical protein